MAEQTDKVVGDPMHDHEKLLAAASWMRRAADALRKADPTETSRLGSIVDGLMASNVEVLEIARRLRPSPVLADWAKRHEGRSGGR